MRPTRSGFVSYANAAAPNQTASLFPTADRCVFNVSIALERRQQPNLVFSGSAVMIRGAGVFTASKRMHLVPVKLADGREFTLSPGKHNHVQAAVVRDFAARFAPGSTILYLGDTAKKTLILEEEALRKLCVPITKHDKLPDIVVYDEPRNWLFLIEAVTSHGPVSPKRKLEMERALKSCTAERIYVSAFPDFKEFRRHIDNIA